MSHCYCLLSRVKDFSLFGKQRPFGEICFRARINSVFFLGEDTDHFEESEDGGGVEFVLVEEETKEL